MTTRTTSNKRPNIQMTLEDVQAKETARKAKVEPAKVEPAIDVMSLINDLREQIASLTQQLVTPVTTVPEKVAPAELTKSAIWQGKAADMSALLVKEGFKADGKAFASDIAKAMSYKPVFYGIPDNPVELASSLGLFIKSSEKSAVFDCSRIWGKARRLFGLAGIQSEVGRAPTGRKTTRGISGIEGVNKWRRPFGRQAIG